MRYSIIHHDVREKFDLTIAQYLVADSIHQLSRNGVCTASDGQMAEFIGFSRESIYRSRAELIKKGIVVQKERGFCTSDSWHESVTLSKNVSPLSKNVSETEQKCHTIKNIKKDINSPAVADAPAITYKEIDTEERPTRFSKAKYPHALEVFSWFPNRQKSWESMKDVKEREYAEFLWVRGEEEVKKRLRYLKSHEGEEFLPIVTKPSDLERKWEDIRAYAKRNS